MWERINLGWFVNILGGGGGGGGGGRANLSGKNIILETIFKRLITQAGALGHK